MILVTCGQITLKTLPGKPSVSPCFDHEFSDRVASRIRNIFASCQNELPGTLNEPIQYQEVFNVCSKLQSGVSGVLIDYEYIRFGGPILWKLLHDLIISGIFR